MKTNQIETGSKACGGGNRASAAGEKDSGNYQTPNRDAPACRMLIYCVSIAMTLPGCSTIKPETNIWRVTDRDTGAIYSTRSLSANYTYNSSWTSSSGTITYTPSQGPNGQMHVDSDSPWNISFAVPAMGSGHTAALKGNGFDFATIRDLKSGRQVKIMKFTADEIKVADMPDLLPK